MAEDWTAAKPPLWEAIIKVNVHDAPEKRARHIEEGIGYACALLHDEYGLSGSQIIDVLEGHISNVEWDYCAVGGGEEDE